MQHQVAGLFVAEERGSHALKGIPEPTVLFRLVRASGGGRHSGQRQLTPLVGRDDEIAMLTRRWERVRQGDGQFVMIVGEPGLGKSRLIEEFHSRLSGTPHTWVEWSCSQLLQKIRDAAQRPPQANQQEIIAAAGFTGDLTKAEIIKRAHDDLRWLSGRLLGLLLIADALGESGSAESVVQTGQSRVNKLRAEAAELARSFAERLAQINEYLDAR